MLEDFLAGTASMARKRHRASTARGFCGFCLMTQIEVQEVQWVQIRPIRLIRGKTEEPVLRRTALQAEASWCVIYPRALPPVTQSSALLAPERLRRPIRGRIRLSRGKGVYLCLMAS